MHLSASALLKVTDCLRRTLVCTLWHRPVHSLPLALLLLFLCALQLEGLTMCGSK